MTNDSVFLNSQIGKLVQIVAVDRTDLPPLILEEVSGLGVVAADETTPHFFPWSEVVEISPFRDPSIEADYGDGVCAALCDSEL